LLSFGALSLCLFIAAIMLFANRKIASVYSAVVGVALFSVLAANTVFDRLESGLTQSNLTPIVEQYGYKGNPILSSKLFARGIRFYAECPVTVMADTQEPYWSPHPIPVLSDDAKIAELLASRDTLLCVLSGGDLSRVNRLLPADRSLDTLASDMGKSVVICVRRIR
jgi:hypothetical protein